MEPSHHQVEKVNHVVSGTEREGGNQDFPWSQSHRVNFVCLRAPQSVNFVVVTHKRSGWTLRSGRVSTGVASSTFGAAARDDVTGNSFLKSTVDHGTLGRIPG